MHISKHFQRAKFKLEFCGLMFGLGPEATKEYEGNYKVEVEVDA